MELVTFEAVNFRNLSAGKLSFDPGINVVFGANAQGKTNLLEAIAVLGTLRSFRTRVTSRIVSRGEREFLLRGEVSGTFGPRVLEEYVEIGPPPRRHLSVDRSPAAPAEYLRVFPAVALTREDSDLVTGDPGGRRSFIDRLVFQLNTLHFDQLLTYRRALAQRNAALGAGSSDAELEAWERELARPAARVTAARMGIIGNFAESFREVYANLRGDDFPDMTVRYRPDPGFEEDDEHGLEKQYRERYAKQRQRDREAGFTQSGPHRHDIVIEAEGRSARDHLSTGQIKLVGASLRLAALELIEAARAERFPVLIDDVDAELDERSVTRLIARAADGRQLFVTSTRTARSVVGNLESTSFTMQRGVCRRAGEDVHESNVHG